MCSDVPDGAYNTNVIIVDSFPMLLCGVWLVVRLCGEKISEDHKATVGI